MKDIKNGLLKGFSVLTISNLLSQVIMMFATIRIARLLKPEFYGEYGVYLAIVSIFLVISSLGLRQIVIRQIARKPENSSELFVISLYGRLFGLIFSTLILLAYQYLKNSELTFVDFLMILSLYSLNFWDSLENVVYGNQKMETVGYFVLIFNIIWLLIIYILPINLFSIKIIFSIQISIQFLKDIIFFFILRRRYLTTIRLKVHNFQDKIKQLFKESFPYYLMFTFGLVITQLPILFLSANSNIHEVAYFNASNKILLPFSLVLSSGLMTLFPHFSKLFIEDKVKFLNHVKSSFLIFTIIGSIGAFLISLFRYEIVLLLFGNEYKNSGLVLAYQCWFVVLNGGILSLIGSVFGAIDKQNLLSKLTIIGSIIAAPILWYGSYYGSEKLSLAYVIFSLIQFSYCWFFLHKSLKEIKMSFFVNNLLIVLSIFVISIIIPEDIPFLIKVFISIILLFLIVFKRNKFKFSNI